MSNTYGPDDPHGAVLRTSLIVASGIAVVSLFALEGFGSNLLAEVVGIVWSIGVAVYVVEILIDRREQVRRATSRALIRDRMIRLVISELGVLRALVVDPKQFPLALTSGRDLRDDLANLLDLAGDDPQLTGANEIVAALQPAGDLAARRSVFSNYHGSFCTGVTELLGSFFQQLDPALQKQLLLVDNAARRVDGLVEGWRNESDMVSLLGIEARDALVEGGADALHELSSALRSLGQELLAEEA